ncbi:mechanosensitive ion channel family protein [Sulfurirhabdus autotrophica]|uniref:Small-conductance mechanosensitive channel n=1 Tax=Sulfurirhabdus autotrophica TaxID=1706046 RepID=A0A4R3XWI3_9PROT|nr:hypothetical protein [Sulfurirhabdus autotrophica]TCV84095.1 putative transporter (transmembrane protein) [Sulfurirhabdus autotrophica]
MQQQLDMFVTSFAAFWQQIAVYTPKLLAALAVLFIGWIVAKLVRTAVRRILQIAHFEKLAQKSGIEEFLQHGEMSITLTGIISEVSYWLVLLIVVVTTSNSLGLQAVASLFNQIALYLPNIIVAILVLVFGTLLARFINRLIFAWLNNLGVNGSLTISTIAEYAVQIFAVFVALEQLNIGTQLITAAFIILFGSICLALALAFGLGGREWAAGVIEKSTSKSSKKPPY